MHTPDPAMDQHHRDPDGHFPDTILAAIVLPMKRAKLKIMYPQAGANAKSVNTMDKT